VGFPSVSVPASRLKSEICRVLKEEGYIHEFEREDDGKHGALRIQLKYAGEDRAPVITEIHRVSRPSLRVYKGKADGRPVRSGLGMSIVTTSKGVMTDRHARKENVGGEILCEVW
jgi:small subunit ribosomal protein S8